MTVLEDSRRSVRVVRRSGAARAADGVIANYIHELAGPRRVVPARPAPPAPARRPVVRGRRASLPCPDAAGLARLAPC